MAMQERIGTPVDGFWGPQSIAACQRHLYGIIRQVKPWPRPDASSLEKFYGEPGDESQLVSLMVPTLGVEYDGKPVKSIRCHHRVAEPLQRVLTELAAGPHAGLLKRYAGCYNLRKKPGGNSYSLHAYGAAIDLDPESNAFHDSWPMQSTMPLEVMETFAKEGFKSGGSSWGFDSMHYEATN